MIDPTPMIARNEWIYIDFEWIPKSLIRRNYSNLEPPVGYAVEDRMTGS